MRAVATELEAARFAAEFGSGPIDERNRRLEEATAAASAIGIPTDDPDALPLPPSIDVVADASTTVLGVGATTGQQVGAQSVVVVLGDSESLVVDAQVTDSVAELTGIGSKVDVAADGGDALSGLIVFIEFADTGGQLITVGLDGGAFDEEPFDDGESVTVSLGDASTSRTGVVELQDADTGTVDILLDQPFFDLNTTVEVAKRSDLDNPMPGLLVSASFLGDERSMIVEVGDGFILGEDVRVVIDGETDSGVLWLPPEAIRGFAGSTFVLVRDSDGLHRVDVELGLVTDSKVVVIGDLASGETVVGP